MFLTPPFYTFARCHDIEWEKLQNVLDCRVAMAPIQDQNQLDLIYSKSIQIHWSTKMCSCWSNSFQSAQCSRMISIKIMELHNST